MNIHDPEPARTLEDIARGQGLVVVLSRLAEATGGFFCPGTSGDVLPWIADTVRTARRG